MRKYENLIEFEFSDGTVKIHADVNASGLQSLIEILPNVAAVLVEDEKDNPAPPVATQAREV